MLVAFDSSLAIGLLVPSPRSPDEVTRIASALFVLTTSGWASVVPRKSVDGLVPAFPDSFQTPLGVPEDGMTEAGNFASAPSGKSWPVVGVVEAWIPLTLLALSAVAAEFAVPAVVAVFALSATLARLARPALVAKPAFFANGTLLTLSTACTAA